MTGTVLSIHSGNCLMIAQKFSFWEEACVAFCTLIQSRISIWEESTKKYVQQGLLKKIILGPWSLHLLIACSGQEHHGRSVVFHARETINYPYLSRDVSYVNSARLYIMVPETNKSSDFGQGFFHVKIIIWQTLWFS